MILMLLNLSLPICSTALESDFKFYYIEEFIEALPEGYFLSEENYELIQRSILMKENDILDIVNYILDLEAELQQLKTLVEVLENSLESERQAVNEILQRYESLQKEKDKQISELFKLLDSRKEISAWDKAEYMIKGGVLFAIIFLLIKAAK